MTAHKSSLSALALVSEPDRLDLERVAAYLATAKNVDEIRDIHDKAKAIAAYHRQRALSIEAQLDATEIALRAERRLGELCKEVTGGKGGGRGNQYEKVDDSKPLLSKLEITPTQSSRWQKLAKVPPKRFDKAIASAREHGTLTTAGVLREATPKREPVEPVWVWEIELVKADNAIDALVDSWPIEHLNDLKVGFQKALRDIERKRGETVPVSSWRELGSNERSLPLPDKDPGEAARRLLLHFDPEWCAAMARSVLAEVESGR